MNMPTPTAEWMENVTFDEMSVGQSARLLRTVTQADIEAFAAVSGDINPAHLNPEYADATMFHGVIAHGMLGAALISALFGTQFPGPGTIYLGQELKFTKPVRIGDTLTVSATVSEKDDEKKRVKMSCLVTNQKGETVLKGDATGEIPQLMADARTLLTNLNALTAEDSALGASMANVKDLTERLKGPGGALQVLMGNAQDARKIVATLDRTNALLARIDGMAAKADQQVFGPGGVLPEVQATVAQLGGLLADTRASLKKVDAVLAEAQAVGANVREGTADLGALRAEVESNLRKIEGLVNDINRKWPFARDTELKLP